jgi:hypothetical protein
MTAIRLDGFGGIAPLLDARKLPPSGATIAHDCKFDGTDLRPLLNNLSQGSLGFTVSRLFKYRFKGQSTWLGWPEPWDVDVVASPVPQDSLGRLYWSRVDPSTANTPTADNYPRVASQPSQAAILANNPGIIRRLGVPQPTAAPTLTEVPVANVISSATIPRTLTNMSQTSPVTVTALNHPFEEGWRVLVERDGEGGDEGMKEIVGLEFIVGDVTSSTFVLRDTDGANYTEFTNATKIKISRVYGVADIEARAYVYTYVTDWGEEGMPSPPSAVTDIRYDSTVNVSCDKQIPAWAATAVNRIRLYRTATGTSGTEFFFVAEAALAGIGTSQTIVDNVEPAGLGELIPSTNWAPAPNALRGLLAMPNGFLVGFIANTIYLSEPYMPHAWPDEYRKTVQDDVVAIAVYAQTVVIATKGKPYLGTGTDPASFTLEQLDLDAPCLNKGGMVSIGSGVMYPTPDGLAFVSAQEQRIITLQHVSKTQWAALWSSTMDAIFHDGRYIAFSRQAGKRTLIIEYNQATGLNISDASVQGRAPAIDPDDDSLNFILVNGLTQNTRYRFEGDTTALTADWQGKVWTLPHAVNLSLGRVFASGYPVTLTVRYANLQANGQTGGVITDSYQITVQGSEPFRLPGGFLSREYQLEVQSAFAVQSIVLTDDCDDLRQQ